MASDMIIAGLASASDPQEKMYSPKGRRDPFIALVGSGVRSVGTLLGVEGPEDLQIEGIAYDPSGSMVVVNGSVLKEGETVGNVKVVSVNSQKAVFEINGYQFSKNVYPAKPTES